MAVRQPQLQVGPAGRVGRAADQLGGRVVRSLGGGEIAGRELRVTGERVRRALAGAGRLGAFHTRGHLPLGGLAFAAVHLHGGDGVVGGGGELFLRKIGERPVVETGAFGIGPHAGDEGVDLRLQRGHLEPVLGGDGRERAIETLVVRHALPARRLGVEARDDGLQHAHLLPQFGRLG